ncbi:TetR/AcrR family transcriptional regulator [Deinococcus pimensis]|uniref:TetR/AcrR family transcriptional regulator n=1 Tax=Deinococcus pimensis TaxID=309888 RepID=UPI0004B389F3|nr:TetR/AcrR family transcriptional regulator [Deinococcus pimensis]
MAAPASRKRLSREESRARTRADLLDAARDLFARQGFEGSSVEQIAEAAGYTRGAFYSNFDDKQALLIALIERCFDDDLRGLAALEGTDLPGASRGFEDAARLPEDDLRVSHLLKMEFWMCALRYPPVREAYEHHHARLRAAIGRLIEAQYRTHGLPLPATPDQLAGVTIALRNGLDTQRLVSPTSVPPHLYGLTLHLLLTGTPPAPPPRDD